MWWESVLSSADSAGLCYPSILGFIRMATNRRLFEKPLNVEVAIGHVERWLGQPNTMLSAPTARHWPLLAKLLSAVGVGANLTTDAHIAALAIEHGYTLCSNDTDFARFQGLRWQNPLHEA
jgi:toxin-antitoxin system PIN domain toxin